MGKRSKTGAGKIRITRDCKWRDDEFTAGEIIDVSPDEARVLIGAGVALPTGEKHLRVHTADFRTDFEWK